MKSVYITSTLLFVALVVLSSCGGQQGSFDRHGKLSPNPKDENLKQQDNQTDLRSGGAPGTVTLVGVVIKADGSIESHITLQQRSGSSEGTTSLTPTQKLVNKSEQKRADNYQPLKTNTYINLGCDLKNDSRIEGLKEASSELSVVGKTKAVKLSADKIFVCGELLISEDSMALIANEINLQAAKIIKKGNGAEVSLITDVLNVEGNNVLVSLGADSNLPSLLEAPNLKLEVYEKVSGTGSLAIKAIGSSYKTSQAEKSSK